MTIGLGKIGVWRHASRLSPDLAAELEKLGYGAVWIGGSPSGDLELADRLLDATTTLVVATGIVNIWKDDPQIAAAAFHRIESRHPGRFLLGIGAGHREQTDARFTKPYEALVHYLDELDNAHVPVQRRLLAALGPRVLRLAADRTAGAHPYLTTPEHTRLAREILGAAPLLAPEHKVVVEPDRARGRAIGRPRVAPYLGMVNYTNSLRRLGFTDTDLIGDGSDQLIDAVVAHGDAATVAERIREHLDAGADHVSVQLLTEPDADPLDGYRQLAEVLLG
jgi:probable F420-dependent oxidoreductase